jgi:glycerol-3-phosphate acyltransferase PlsY
MISFNQYFIYLISYLIGSIPFGIIVTKLAKTKDITQHGSKNIGATNVARVAGKKLGAIVLLCDLLKGVIAVSLAIILSIDSNPIKCFSGVAVVLGHIFPVWLKFKGGKGVATGFGTALVLVKIPALIILGVWILVFKLTKISSASALAAVSLLPIFVFFSKPPSEYHLIYSIIISLIIFAKHRENIKRLINGEESSFKK